MINQSRRTSTQPAEYEYRVAELEAKLIFRRGNVAAPGQDDAAEPVQLDQHLLTAVKIIGERERWSVLRTGDRDPILWPVRLGVARRDSFICQTCHQEVPHELFELDHVVPWSHMGADESTNLRLLCAYCNQTRSNFRDGSEERLRRPVTWWCTQCWTDPYDSRLGWQTGDVVTQWLNIAHRVDAEVADTTVYCAHCRSYGLSDVHL